MSARRWSETLNDFWVAVACVLGAVMLSTEFFHLQGYWGPFPFGSLGAAGELCYKTEVCRKGLRCAALDDKGRPRRAVPDEEDVRKTCFRAGGEFELCGEGRECAAGLSCVLERCVRAGGEDEPCMAGMKCDRGLSCRDARDLYGREYRRCGGKTRAAAVAGGGRLLCILTVEGAVKCLDATRAADRGRTDPFPSAQRPHCVALDTGDVACGSEPPARPRVYPRTVEGLDRGVASVSVGGSHACAVTSVGAVRCWGANGSGQLGDGTRVASGTPVEVAGLGARATAVAAGEAHTCALLDGGRVKCWGANDHGQLGDGSTAGSPTPVEVKGIGGVKAIAAGFFFTAAIAPSGDVLWWGALRKEAAAGDKLVELDSTTATVESFGAGARELAAGRDALCAVLADGSRWCDGVPAAGGFFGLWEHQAVEAMGAEAGEGLLCAIVKWGEVRCFARDKCHMEIDERGAALARIKGEKAAREKVLVCPSPYEIPGTGP